MKSIVSNKGNQDVIKRELNNFHRIHLGFMNKLLDSFNHAYPKRNLNESDIRHVIQDLLESSGTIKELEIEGFPFECYKFTLSEKRKLTNSFRLKQSSDVSGFFEFYYSEVCFWYHKMLSSENKDSHFLGMKFLDFEEYNLRKYCRLLLKKKQSIRIPFVSLIEFYRYEEMYIRAIKFCRDCIEELESFEQTKRDKEWLIELITVLDSLADFLAEVNRYEEALVIAHKTLNLFLEGKEKNESKKAQLYNQIGSMYMANKQFKEAKGYLNTCIRICGDKMDLVLGAALYNLGKVESFKEDDIDLSISYYERALKIYKEQGDYHTCIKLISLIAEVKGFKSEIDDNEQLNHLIEASEWFGKEKDWIHLIVAKIQIARYHINQSSYSLAIIELEEVKNIIGYKNWKVDFFNSEVNHLLGYAYLSSNNNKAETYFKKSLDQKPLLSNVQSRMSSCNDLALLYLVTGDYASSEKYSTKGIELARQLEDVICEANLNKNLGDIKRLLGEFDESRDFLNESLSLLEGNESSYTGYYWCFYSIVLSFGILEAALKNHEKSYDYYTRCIDAIAKEGVIHQKAVEAVFKNVKKLSLQYRQQKLIDDFGDRLLRYVSQEELNEWLPDLFLNEFIKP